MNSKDIGTESFSSEALGPDLHEGLSAMILEGQNVVVLNRCKRRHIVHLLLSLYKKWRLSRFEKSKEVNTLILISNKVQQKMTKNYMFVLKKHFEIAGIDDDNFFGVTIAVIQDFLPLYMHKLLELETIVFLDFEENNNYFDTLESLERVMAKVESVRLIDKLQVLVYSSIFDSNTKNFCKFLELKGLKLRSYKFSFSEALQFSQASWAPPASAHKTVKLLNGSSWSLVLDLITLNQKPWSKSLIVASETGSFCCLRSAGAQGRGRESNPRVFLDKFVFACQKAGTQLAYSTN